MILRAIAIATGLGLAFSVCPARAELERSPSEIEALATNYGEMMRRYHADMDRRIQLLVTERVALPEVQRAFEAYRQSGGQLTVEQFGHAHLATNGFLGGTITPDQAYRFAMRRPTYNHVPERWTRDPGRGYWHPHIINPTDLPAVTVRLPDGRQIALPAQPRAAYVRDPLTGHLFYRSADNRVVVWIADERWAELAAIP